MSQKKHVEGNEINASSLALLKLMQNSLKKDRARNRGLATLPKQPISNEC